MLQSINQGEPTVVQANDAVPKCIKERNLFAISHKLFDFFKLTKSKLKVISRRSFS
jgi:hypothetical protein